MDAQRKRLLIATPAGRGSRTGNRVTALRWAAFLRSAGHHVKIIGEYDDEAAELMIALHARRTLSMQMAFKRQGNASKCVLIVALTGTDIYHGWPNNEELQWAKEAIDGIIVLQTDMKERLPASLQARCLVLMQSSALTPVSTPVNVPVITETTCESALRLIVAGHLRAEKAPFLLAESVHQYLPSARLLIQHCGGEVTSGYVDMAKQWMVQESRYHYLGELTRRQTHEHMRNADILVNTSTVEGAPAVVIEAVASHIAVIASDIPAHKAILGERYPGLFPVGDALALAKLITRVLQQPAFLSELRRHIIERAVLFTVPYEKARLLHWLAQWLK